MQKLVAYLGMFIGSTLGWIVGAWISLFMAFILSMVGLGLGLYAARRLSRRLLP